MRGLIVGNTLISAHNKLDELIKDYELFWNIKPRRVVKSKYNFQVEFENNDIWQTANINTNSHGRRCNILLIDKNIPKEFRSIYEPFVINRPYGGICYY